jgi:hypothetical protein
MKHLKHFNEEINPLTYIRAGKSLKYDGKKKSGNKLIDYGYEQGHGFYTAHIQYGSQQAVYNGKITNPICNFYYGIPEWDGPQSNVNTKLTYVDSEEELVMDWKNGNRELSFTLEFRFTPSEELKETVKDNESIKDSIDNYKGFHLFTMVVNLSDWSEGLSYYNYAEDLQDEKTGEWGIQFKPGDDGYMDLTKMYHNSKMISIKLDRIMDKYIYGIFDDRKSARKFIQNLPELVSKHKGKIMSILEILDGGSDELEDILDSFRQIRINSLYQNEVIKGSNLYKNWYKPNCFNRYS